MQNFHPNTVISNHEYVLYAGDMKPILSTKATVC